MSLNKLKPQRKSKYKQGYIDPVSCKKYVSSSGNPMEPITYRSSLEYRFIQFCETASNISKWSPEPLEIKYRSGLDGKTHKYYPDFVIESTDGKRIVIEIKPYAQTIKPKNTATAYDKEQWLRNCSKWNYAISWCKERGYKFMIITEKFFTNY